MNTPLFTKAHGSDFDLFRLSRSKETVDLAPNTVREMHKQGLPFYRHGRAIFVSRREVEAFIRKPSNEKHSELFKSQILP